jgi:hypothetical protein
MDSQTSFVAVIASLAMLIFGSFYLGSDSGSGTGTADGAAQDVAEARPQALYSPDDVRYKYQQEEIRRKQKEKKLHPGGMPKTTSAPASSSGSDSGASDDSDDEPSLSDHEPQEEPELE